MSDQHETQHICQWFYECKACGVLLKPKNFYGTTPCPPIQQGGGLEFTAY